MDLKARDPIGVRIAEWRSTAGLSQTQLAERVGNLLGRDRPFTAAYISMVENGHRAVTNRQVLIAFARALALSLTDLTGQPYPATAPADLESYVLVPAVRAALDGPDQDEETERRPIEQLAFAADRAMAARMACDFPGLGAHLPGLLSETRVRWLQDGDPQVGELLVKAAVTGALALKPAGWIDLSYRLAELAEQAAVTIGDPVLVGAARFALAQCALAAGNQRRSLRLAAASATDMAETARHISDRYPMRRAALLTWAGMLDLHAALTAATLHRGGDADGHLDSARRIASDPAVHGDPWRMEFTPANVATWAVGIALENGEPSQAPRLAQMVAPAQLMTRHRRARLHLDTGRAYHLLGDVDAATVELIAADDAAPGDLRNRPSAVEIVNHMLHTDPRGGSALLQDLAVRVGIDPLLPRRSTQ